MAHGTWPVGPWPVAHEPQAVVCKHSLQSATCGPYPLGHGLLAIGYQPVELQATTLNLLGTAS